MKLEWTRNHQTFPQIEDSFMNTNVLRDKKWATVREGTEDSLQQSLPTRFKGWLRIVMDAKTFNVPSWAAAVFLGVLLTAAGAIYWRLSDKLQESHDSNIRMEQALADLKDSMTDKLKPVERQGLLNDEHQRALDKDFAEFKGFVRGKSGDKFDQSKGAQ